MTSTPIHHTDPPLVVAAGRRSPGRWPRGARPGRAQRRTVTGRARRRPTGPRRPPLQAAAAPDDDSSVTQTHDWQDDEGTSRSRHRHRLPDQGPRHPPDRRTSPGRASCRRSTRPGPDSVHQAPQAGTASGYPVVLMECQGDDAATMTPATARSPTPTASTTTRSTTRTRPTRSSTRRSSTRATSPRPAARSTTEPTGQYVPLPSDYDDSNVLGTTWYATWTNDDGTHHNARFEVRSTKEAPAEPRLR